MKTRVENKIYRKICLLSIFILSILLNGCTQKSEPKDFPDLPEFSLNQEQMNSDLNLIVIKSMNNYKIDSSVQVLVHLQSDSSVLTKTDGNIEMYIFDEENEKWKPVSDYKYYQDPTSTIIIDPPEIKDIVLKPGKKGEDGFYVVLHPVIEDVSHSIQLLIVSYGDLFIDNKATEKVGAYEVITLYP